MPKLSRVSVPRYRYSDGDGAVPKAVESALRNLGYSSQEARAGIESVDWKSSPSTQEALAIALPGDGDTVRCTGSTPGLTDRAWRGSVARWAWDLSDRDHSRWGVPFGAAGDGASPHFADQLDTWTAGSAERLVTDWSYLRADVGTGAA